MSNLNKSKKIILLGLAGVVLAGIGLLIGSDTISFSLNKKRVIYTYPQKEVFSSSIQTVGTVIPTNILEIKSSVASEVKGFVFQEGDQVIEGEKLLELDTEEEHQQLKVSEANVAQTKANIDTAKASYLEAQFNIEQRKKAMELEEIKMKELENTSFVLEEEGIVQARILYRQAEEDYQTSYKLMESGATKEEELRNAEVQRDLSLSKLNIAEEQLTLAKEKNAKAIEQARKTLEQAKKSYEAALQSAEVAQSSYKAAQLAYNIAFESFEVDKIQLKSFEITSPINGEILKKHINKGDYIQPGQILYTMIEKPLLVEMNPDERELKNIYIGAKAWISPEAYPNLVLSAQVYKIDTEVDVQRGTIKVYLKLLGDDDRLLPNMSVSIEILESEDEEVIILSSDYILQEENQSYVFIYNDGIAKKKMVEVGYAQDGFTEIINGLGTEDIILWPEALKPNMEISLKE